MAKTINRLGEISKFPSYREGEKFLCSVPEDLCNLNLRKNGGVIRENSELAWDPWPKSFGTVRLGRHLLMIDEKYSWTDHYSKNKNYVRMIAEADEHGQPIEWMRFDLFVPGNVKASKIKYYLGKRARDIIKSSVKTLPGVILRVKSDIEDEIHKWVIAENYKVGRETYAVSDRAFLFNERNIQTRVLKTPEGVALEEARCQEAMKFFDLSEVEIRTALGNKKGSLCWRFGENYSPSWEFQYREHFLVVEAEWARKQLMKLQRATRKRLKEKELAERNIDAATFAAEKAEQVRLERRVKRTVEWVKVSKDVHNSIDWLQEFARRIGDSDNIDQKWFDENRRELRTLATKLKPLGRVLND